MDDLLEQGIFELQGALARGEITAVSLLHATLERIERIDGAGGLNAVLELNPDAEALAAELDAERQQKRVRSLLHGLPVLLKGNIDTGDRMQTTAGSLALAGHRAAQDAFHVARLREAGALILGKTNLSEWANFRSTRSSSGWSSQGGQTRNPHALDRNPCGSSSGSGAAVAAALCVGAVGTETDGSIVCPANAGGVVGLKPTIGLVSRSGIIPLAHSQDTAGPMARSVADTAVLLGAMIGHDPADVSAGELGLPPRPPEQTGDYTSFLQRGGLRGARLGVIRNLCGDDPHVGAVLEASLAALRDLGAEIIDVEIKAVEKLDEPELEVLLYEFKAGLDAYLGGLGPETAVHSLADVIAFNAAHADTVMPYFGQEHMLAAGEKGPLTDEPYRKALAECRRLSRDEGLDAALDGQELHALLAPTGGPAWLTDWVNGDHFGGSSSSLAAVSGYPSISVPAGTAFGLPLNVSFIARPWQEGPLLRLAYAFEQATQARVAPQFRASIF
jgi:amidase